MDKRMYFHRKVNAHKGECVALLPVFGGRRWSYDAEVIQKDIPGKCPCYHQDAVVDQVLQI